MIGHCELPLDCRFRVEVNAPGRAAGDVLTVSVLMERPETARAVFEGPRPLDLCGDAGIMLAVNWLTVPSVSPDALRAAVPALASRVAAELGGDVREVAVWELPVVDQWWPFWVGEVKVTEGDGD